MEAHDRATLLREAYQRFNSRDVDGLLAMMTEEVLWPDVANRSVLRGKEGIRAYWLAQFAASDPRVEPTDFVEVADDLVAVVDQRILDREGRVLAGPSIVFHRYSFDGGLVSQMRWFADRDEALSTT